MSSAVILIHGYITSPNDFLSLYESLYNKYDYVHKVTLPGHDDNSNYKNFKFLPTIDLLLDTYYKISKEYDKIDLIGFSLGGALASALACKFKFNKVVLLAPCNKYLRLGFLGQYFKMRRYYKKEYKNYKKQNKVIEAKKYLELAKDTKKNNELSIKLGLFHLIPHYTPRTIMVFRKLVKWSNNSLKKNDSKTLIIWGKLDQLVPYSSLVYLSKYFMNCKKIIYEDISHLMLGSVNYQKIVDDIMEFLEDETL
jgi:esterase/lipase